MWLEMTRHFQPHFFGNPVATICPSRTYNVQVKNAIALENERIATFL